MPIVYDWTHTAPWNNDDKEWSKQFRHQLFGADLDSTNRNPRFKYPITIQAVASNTTTLFTIDEDYNGVALSVDTEATTVNGVDISPAVMTTGIALDIGDADALTTGGIANFVSNSADTSTRTLQQITNDNSAATGTTVFGLKQDSTGNIEFLHSTAAGATGVTVEAHHDSASPAISDVAFRLSMRSEDDNSSKVESARMDVVLDTVTSGSDSAHVNFVVRSAGAAVTPLSVYGDGIRLANTVANPMIQATNTVATATGVIWEGHHNSASPAGSDVAFRLAMFAEDDNSSKIEYAKLETVVDTVTSGSTGGHVAFSVVSAGSAINILNVHGDRIAMASAAATQMIDTVNTNAGATGVIWSAHHNSASPANSDIVFRLSMNGENADSTLVEYGRIDTRILAVDSTAQASRMSFYVQSGATSVESMRVEYGKVTTNEISNISTSTADVYDRVNDLEILSLYGAEPDKRETFYEIYAKEGLATRDPDGTYWIDDKQERKLFRGAFKQTWNLLQELRADVDAAKAMIQAQA